MGNQSVKSSKKQKHFCCFCSSTNSLDSKSISTLKENHHLLPISDNSLDLIINSNRDLLHLINKYQLKYYLNDYRNRSKIFSINQTFQKHFSLSTIIYPCHGLHQSLTDQLNLFLLASSESILPYLSIDIQNSSKIHEQIRSKCYFIPSKNDLIEPNDEQYKQQKMLSNDQNSSILFLLNENFQTGTIRIDCEKVSKEFLPFISHSIEDNFDYLSAKFIQKWFQMLIHINRTCTIAKQFLLGNKTHLTCLIKEQTNRDIFETFDKHLIFACLRLPSSCSYIQNMNEEIIDEFPSFFLSDNRNISHDHIHIDYEQYSFALKLSRWPRTLIENYLTHSTRFQTRKWPTNEQINLVLNKSLLLIPDQSTDQWRISYDFIEQYLFELMNDLTLFFYLLCQQLFSQTYSKRILIKHCFLNFLEKYDLSFSNKKTNLFDLLNLFYKYLSEQIKKKFLPNYFNYQINLYNPNENYHQWFEYITDRMNFSSSSSPFQIISNRSIMIEFLFDFMQHLYHINSHQQSNFCLNETILLDFHRQICEKFSQKNLQINENIRTHIQKNLIENFEVNAELVHSCINQIRKSQSSLIFHYTWTIFIQYLHTYVNVLWNTEYFLDE